MISRHIFPICLLLTFAAGQTEYNSDQNNPNYNNFTYNYPNNPNNTSNYNDPNYRNQNYNDRNNQNYNDRNNQNYNDRNNQNYNDRNNQNYNDRNNQNYNDRDNQNYNDRNNQNYNDRNNQNYNDRSNTPSYTDRNNQNYNDRNNQNFNDRNSNQNYNDRNNQNYNPNNPNSNQNYNPSYNLQPLDQGGDCCEEYCYTQDPEPYLNFGTKTAYDSLTKRGGSQHRVPGCTPVQFWSLLRQGTRLPDASTIRAMRNINRIHDDIARNYEQRRSYPDRGRLCPQDYDLFRKWRFNESIHEGVSNTLTRQGVDDMKLLARRYKAKYPEILQNYDERSYYFQYSTDDRTHDSFQAYIEGLFDQDAFKVHANTINGNRLTDPFQNCPKWQENTNTQFITRSEVDRFREKSEYQKMVRDVFRRLGFRFALNSTVIEDMYNLCRYEKAWNPQPRSPWCVAFNKEQLKLLEYVEDLKYFYDSGYGNKLVERIGCSPIKDMYERFERTVNGNSDGNKATFIFGQTDSFLSALTTLGIGKDFNVLNSENYYQQGRRNWRTSTMSPFAGNLVATLYECSQGEKYQVMFFLNENPVEFEGCSVGLCNWSRLQQKYQDLVRSCNADDFCNGRPGGAVRNSVTLATLLSTLIVAFRL